VSQQRKKLTDFLNVSGLKTFGALGDIKSNFVTFRKRLEAFPLDCGEMYKDVFATFLLNKTESLCVVEPFNFSLCHFPTSFSFRGYAGLCVILPKFPESNAGKPQSRIKHWFFNVLQELPKLAANVVYHRVKLCVKKINMWL